MASAATSDKRQRIMDAAIQVFAAKGFYGARISDIARAAQVADGTIYLYFKNKDDLLISLFEDRMEVIVAQFRRRITNEPSAKARLRGFIDQHLQMVAEQPTLAEVLTRELRQSAKFVREYPAPKFSEYLDLIEEIIEYGRQTGEFDSQVAPKVLKRALFGALDEVSLHWVTSRRQPYTLEAAAEDIWRLCAQGMLRQPARSAP